MQKEDEKKPDGWQMQDPKPPVVRAGRMEGRIRQ